MVEGERKRLQVLLSSLRGSTITSVNTPQHHKVSIPGTDDLGLVNFGIYQGRAVGLVIIISGAKARTHSLAGPISFPI